jgi:hypothetical protein
MPRSTDKSTSGFVHAIAKFLPIAVRILEIEKLPKIVPVLVMPGNDEQGSFGAYNDATETIYIAIEHRHPIDILRTLAHELVHWRQREEDRLPPGAGATGSPEENEANAMAGVVLREFGKKYPKFFNEPAIIKEDFEYVQNNIAYHDTLNSAAWKNDRLRPEVKLKLMQIAKVFVDYLEIPDFKVLDIVLTGSMCNYNYTKYSDFDLHIVTRYSDLQCDDIAAAFYRAKKQIWNDAHDVTIRGYDVELYVEDSEEPPVSAGVYSILNDRWINEPKFEPPSIDDSAVNHKVHDLIKQIDTALATADDSADIQRITDKIRKMRRSGLDQYGEFGVENLAYKVLRNLGYIDKLIKAHLHKQDDELSL